MNLTKKHNATHHSPAAQPFLVPFYRTHAFRIFVTFVLFGATLSLGFGWAVIDQMERIRKKMDLFKIQEYAEAYLANDPNNIPTHPIDKFLSIYDDIQAVPEPYHSLLKDREDGSYFSDGRMASAAQVNIAISSTPYRAERRGFTLFWMTEALKPGSIYPTALT